MTENKYLIWLIVLFISSFGLGTCLKEHSVILVTLIFAAGLAVSLGSLIAEELKGIRDD